MKKAAIVPAIVVITIIVGVKMNDRYVAAKANMDAVDALEKRVNQKDEKPVPTGKMRIPVDLTIASLEAIEDMFEQLGSSNTTKSDTTNLCIEIAYMLFKEIQAGGEVYEQHIRYFNT